MLPKLTFSPQIILQFILLFNRVYKVHLYTIDPRYSFTDYVFANSLACLNLFTIPKSTLVEFLWSAVDVHKQKSESPDVHGLAGSLGICRVAALRDKCPFCGTFSAVFFMSPFCDFAV